MRLHWAVEIRKRLFGPGRQKMNAEIRVLVSKLFSKQRRHSRVVSALDSIFEGPGFDSPLGHGVVSLGKTLYTDFPHFTQV